MNDTTRSRHIASPGDLVQTSVCCLNLFLLCLGTILKLFLFQRLHIDDAGARDEFLNLLKLLKLLVSELHVFMWYRTVKILRC